MDALLEKLDFPVAKQDLFDSTGRKLTDYQVIKRTDTNEDLAVVSPHYKLVPHAKAIEPILNELGPDWKITQAKLEANGARAYVKVVNDKFSVDVDGHPIIPQLVIPNSYNRTKKWGADLGFWRIICGNGLKVPVEGFPTLSVRITHIGDVETKFGDFLNGVTKFVEKVPEVVTVYQKLTDKAVSPELAKDIVKEVLGEKKQDKVLWYWTNGRGQVGKSTAWALYNGITEYLSHDFKGAEHLSTAYNQKALAKLLSI